MGTKVAYTLLNVFILILHALQNFFQNSSLNKSVLKFELFKKLQNFSSAGILPPDLNVLILLSVIKPLSALNLFNMNEVIKKYSTKRTDEFQAT